MKKTLTQINGELQIQIGMLKTENSLLKQELEKKSDDEIIREELSKALHAPTISTQEYGYSSRKEVQTIYTWFEIFREVGKLLEKKNYQKFEEDFNKIKAVTESTQRWIEEYERSKWEKSDRPSPRCI